MDVEVVGAEVEAQVHEVHPLPHDRDAVAVVPAGVVVAVGGRHREAHRRDGRARRQALEGVLADQPHRDLVVDGRGALAAEHLVHVGLEVARVAQDHPVARLADGVHGPVEGDAVERPVVHLGGVVAVVADERRAEADRRLHDEVELGGPEAVPLGVGDGVGRGQQERQDPAHGDRAATPGVDVADLGHELEGVGVQLDRSAGIPGRVEAVAPGQRRGVGAVGRAEGRGVAGGPGREQLGVPVPEPLAGRLDGDALPAEPARRRAAGPRLQRQSADGPEVEDGVGQAVAVQRARVEDLTADVGRPLPGDDLQVEVTVGGGGQAAGCGHGRLPGRWVPDVVNTV